MPDSPYAGQLTAARINDAFFRRISPTDADVPEAKGARETRDRVNAAVEALKALDAEELFGSGADRDRITLLIEVGDGSDEFRLKPAKKLNPPRVFKEYAAAFASPTLGRWSEFGASVTCQTQQITTNDDCSLIAVSSEHEGCIFELPSGRRLFRSKCYDPKAYNLIVGAAITRSGDQAAFLVDGGSELGANWWLCMFQGQGWKTQVNFKLDVRPDWNSFVGAPNGLWYAMGCFDKSVRIVSAEGQPIAALRGHRERPRSVDLSPDGAFLASIDEESGIRIWRTSDWALERTLVEARGTCVRYRPDGDRVLSVLGLQRTFHAEHQTEYLTIRTFPGLEVVKQHRFPGFKVGCARFSPHGEAIALALSAVAGPCTHPALVIDAETGRELRRLLGPKQYYDDFVFLPQRNAIALAGRNDQASRQLVIWELSDELGRE